MTMSEKIIEVNTYQQEFITNLLKKKYNKKIIKIKEQILKNPEKKNELNKEIMYLEEEYKEEIKLIRNIDKYELNKNKKIENFYEKNLNEKEIKLLEYFDKISSKYSSDNLYKDFLKRISNIEKYIKKVYLMNINEFLNSEKIKIGKFYLPNYLYKFLFEFQRQGIIFLQKKNVLLADEMGLGKTLQIISLIAGKYMINGFNRAIILAPVSVIIQWIKEIYNYFPFFRILVYHNSYENFNFKLLNDKEMNTIIITSYETFLGYANNFYLIKYDFIILDEGHKIKNNNTKIFKAINLIEADSRLIITGTPIQNNIKELWCLFNFIRPKLLGNQIEFEKNYLINYSNNEKITKDSHLMLIYIKELIKPYLLRREKKMLLHELPPKKERIVLCPMTEYQEILYEEELEKQKKIFNKGEEKIKRSFRCIFNLRKICNYPNDNNLKELKINDLENISKKKVGKFEVMKCLLKKFKKENRKTLIFTQTIKMLDFISEYLKSQNILFKRIEGKITLKERDKAIRIYKESNKCNIMILTTRVGCLGLNLVMASRLIIYDPDWNPSIDKQARERIFRFGQKKDVETYVLLSMGTIEEKIYQKQLFKIFLSNDILSNENIKELEKEMKDLLSYKKLNKLERKKGIIEDIKEEEKEINCISGKELIDFIRYRELKLKNNSLLIN